MFFIVVVVMEGWLARREFHDGHYFNSINHNNRISSSYFYNSSIQLSLFNSIHITSHVFDLRFESSFLHEERTQQLAGWRSGHPRQSDSAPTTRESAVSDPARRWPLPILALTCGRRTQNPGPAKDPAFGQAFIRR